MSDDDTVTFQLTGPTLEGLKEALGHAGALEAGAEICLSDGAVLRVEEVFKASGMAETAVILIGAVTFAKTVGASVTSALLVEWLKSRLFKTGAKATLGGQTVGTH